MAPPVRERVQKYFNPDVISPQDFRDKLNLGLLGLLLAEVVVYILLKRSADLGELPYYITDALIIGISSVEFLSGWLIGWLGSRRRRSVLVLSALAVLVSVLLLFAAPAPEITPDAGLCTSVLPFRTLPDGISAKAAVRLSLLLICGLICALARVAFMTHGLAYLDEFNPSDNLQMHVANFILRRVLVLLVGTAVLKHLTLSLLWLPIMVIVIILLFTVTQLYRFPEVAPRVTKELGSDRSLCRSLGRVLSSGVAMLQILSMSLLAAAFWGFGMHDDTFAQVKYHLVNNDAELTAINRQMAVGLGVVLSAFIYTGPVMPKYDKKGAIRNAGFMGLLTAVLYVMLTALFSCNRGEIAGLGELTYTPPACGQTCGCDRPWMEYTPVCVSDQVTTYFSPCHAGCSSSDTINNVGVYTNCTCALGGLVTTGACADGRCASGHGMHQIMLMVTALFATLALVWQMTVMIESVDRRDVAVAVGVATGVVSLVAFVAAHGYYLGISHFTCVFSRGSKCLFHSDSFVSWVGYSSVTLAGLSMVFSIVAFVVLQRQKPKEEEDVVLN